MSPSPTTSPSHASVPVPACSSVLVNDELERVRTGTDDGVATTRVALLAVEVVHVAQPAVGRGGTSSRRARCPSRAARPRATRPSAMSTSAAMRVRAVRTFTATLSGTGAPNGRYTYCVALRGAGAGAGSGSRRGCGCRAGAPGSARASSHQRSTSAASRSGSSSARSRVSDGSSATWYSSHTSSSKGASKSLRPVVVCAERLERHRLPALGGRSPREPSISKYCVSCCSGASARVVGEQVARSSCPRSARCATPSSSSGASMPDELEHGREHVDRVGELAAHATALVAKPARPAHDARIGDAALVDLALPAPERRVAGHRPAPRVVVVQRRARRARRCGRAAPCARRRRRSSRRTSLIEPCAPPSALAPLSETSTTSCRRGRRSARGTSSTRPICVVGVREERGEALHEPRRDRLVGLVQVVPRRHPRGSRRQRGARRDDARRELAGVRALAPRVPPVVELAAVARDPLGRRVVRRVARAGREVAGRTAGRGRRCGGRTRNSIARSARSALRW